MFLPINIPPEMDEVLSELDDKVRETHINNCVHAIIVLGQDRATIKKADINRLVFPNTYSRTIPGAVIQAANCELNKIFGMRLFESLDKTKLILVNLKAEFSKYMSFSDSACQEATVLYFTLMDIFAAPDDSRTEEDLIEALSSSLEFSADYIKSQLDLMVKRNYLALEKTQESKLYSWGDRTIAEIDPTSFFGQFIDLVGETTEKDWPDLERKIEKLKRMPHRQEGY